MPEVALDAAAAAEEDNAVEVEKNTCTRMATLHSLRMRTVDKIVISLVPSRKETSKQT